MTTENTSQEPDLLEETVTPAKKPSSTPRWVRVMDVVVVIGGLIGVGLFILSASNLIPAWVEYEKTLPVPTEDAEEVESEGDGEVLFEFSWP